MRQASMIRQTLYALNREYGRPIIIVKSTATTRDFTKGSSKTDVEKFPVSRAIVLPSLGARDFDYDLSYIAANKNFTYGGFFQKSTRPIIIELKHLPKDFVIDHENHVDFDGMRWEIKKITKVLEARALILVVHEIQSEAPRD